jgi:hypothetical protein
VAIEDVTRTPEAVLLQSLRNVKDDNLDSQYNGKYASEVNFGTVRGQYFTSRMTTTFAV